MQDTILSDKVVIVGAGAVVRECFLPALDALNLLGSVTVVDSNPAVTQLSERYPAARFVAASYQDWLRACDPDEFRAAVIALPNAFHEEAVQLAFARSLDVLCEKPLTLSSETCRDLADRAVSAGRLLAVNMVRRLFPSVKLARFALERGLVGKLRSVVIEHGGAYAWPAETLAPFRRENGGVLADMGVHYLDLARSFTGDLTPREYSDDDCGGVEADLTYSLVSDEGVAVRIQLSRLRTLTNRIVLEGSDGRLEFGVGDMDRCVCFDKSGSRIEISAPEPFTAGDFRPTFEACFAQQMHDFLAASKHGRIGPMVDGYDAAKTIALIEWAYANRKRPSPSRLTSAYSSGEPEPGPVLVTGATGFIGSHLVEHLFARGFSDVTSLVRGPRNCATIARFPGKLQTADLLNAEAVRNAVRGQRYVFHLAYGREGGQRRDITVEGTRNVVNAATAEGCEAVVVLSTAYVFGWPAQTVDESAPYSPTGGEYGTSKAEMEKWCLQAAAASSRTRIVILNPTCVYGPRGATYSELPVNLARQSAFCWVNGGAGAANYTYVSNLIDAMLLSAAKREAHGERFLINDGTATWRDFMSPILEPWLDSIPSYTSEELARLGAAGKKSIQDVVRTVIGLQEFRSAARATALGETAAKLVRKFAPAVLTPKTRPAGILRPANTAPPVVPPIWLGDLFPNYSTRFSSEKAARILGWKPRVDLTEGQRLTVEYLRWRGLLAAQPAPVAVG